MKASVFFGTSVDGFIARRDGALDFLPHDGGEEHGYEAFIASVDALVIGCNTYQTVLSFDALFVNPVAVGRGMRVFKDRKPLRLTGSPAYPSGIVVNSYEPA